MRMARGTGRFPVSRTLARAFSMAIYEPLLLGEDARYTVVSASGIRPSGMPILLTTSKQAFASSSALGFASPTSSEALRHSLRAMNSGSSPPSIMRAR